jgi:hypothetical protein
MNNGTGEISQGPFSNLHITDNRTVDIPQEPFKETINTGILLNIASKKDGMLYIKISVSNNINYDINNAIINDYFLVSKVVEFYNFLIHHTYLTQKKENDHYIMSPSEYKHLLKIIKGQYGYYNHTTSINIQRSSIIKKIQINRGNKIQRYTPQGELIETYNGIRDATRNVSITDAKLIATINNKTLHNGSRWAYLRRDLPDDTVQNIGETVIKTKYKNGCIAMIDIDKKTILNVFINQKEASIARKLKSSASINHSIMHGNLCSGHYFQYYDDCSEELKKSYVDSGKVLPTTVIKGIIVKQYNYTNGELINEFPSLLDVQIRFQVSNKSLKKAIETGEVLKEFIWKH